MKMTYEVRTRKYLLMHKDVVAGEIYIMPETDAVVGWNVVSKEHAPMGHDRTGEIAKWLTRRTIPALQKNTPRLPKGKTRFYYMIENMGLSLSDSYWIKQSKSALSWEDVNLYENDFQETDFRLEQPKSIGPFAPSSTTGGNLFKRWAVKDGERILTKGNSTETYRQSINEVFATLIHERQGRPHVKYELTNLPESIGGGIGCACSCFATESAEFIPAYDVASFGKKRNNVSVMQHYIDVAEMFGIDKEVTRDFMDYQILSDFCITNTDRHLLNFGMLRNTETLAFESPAPIFDSGNSMFFDRMYNANNVLDIAINSLYRTEVKQMEHVRNRNALDIDKLPTVSEIKRLYEADPFCGMYIENMASGYEKKVELLAAFQRGYSLNQRSQYFFEGALHLETKDEKEDEHMMER